MTMQSCQCYGAPGHPDQRFCGIIVRTTGETICLWCKKHCASEYHQGQA